MANTTMPDTYENQVYKFAYECLNMGLTYAQACMRVMKKYSLYISEADTITRRVYNIGGGK